MTEFAYANQEQAFAVIETTAGTLQKPAATDRFYTVGAVTFSQERELLEDGQIRASASALSAIAARLTPGEASFTTYVKPSGTKGIAPEAAVLFKALMGKETVVTNTKVEYTLEDELPSFSLWVKKGHTVFAFRGVVAESAEFAVNGESLGEIRWTCKFIERLWAGESSLDVAVAQNDTTLSLPAGEAVRYCVGMYVKVDDDDNTGLGYKITAVDYENDELTITPGVAAAHSIGAVVSPWLPSAGAEVGEPVHGKLGLVSIAGNTAIVTGATVRITNNIKFYENEKNNVWTAETFGRPGKRAVEGSITAYFAKEGVKFFYKSNNNLSEALVVPVGNVDGKILEISVPKAVYKAPSISGDEEFVEEVPFIAVASSALNDELKLTFK